ncbi:CdaR family transcriptional regulator [Lentzea sp. HUAS12]|uniref:PucR family transcriptional regulator n=1 Tax=Lentzea sp. HUAS12 TaxID=2951806 RepID=UPI0020A1B2A4|nr:PucR family transcriptional regulator [Lentzea sp. HUAS12]USX54034.1 helix-turn-helix domain-containing protein [Lentzea sp. HUAS12]
MVTTRFTDVALEAGEAFAESGRSVHTGLAQLRFLLTRIVHEQFPAGLSLVGDLVDELLQAFFLGFHLQSAHRLGTRLTTSYAEITPPPRSAQSRGVAAADKVLSIGTSSSGRLLIAADVEASKRLLAELHPGLEESHWTGVADSTGSTSGDGAQEQARRIAVITQALAYPPGIYERRNVFLELLAVQDGEAESSLVSVVSKVLHHDVLVRTLEVLFHTNGNRNEAARRLFVHRSTLDYRMNRISQLTGWDPANAPDLMLFRAGFAAIAVSRHRDRGLNIA